MLPTVFKFIYKIYKIQSKDIIINIIYNELIFIVKREEQYCQKLKLKKTKIFVSYDYLIALINFSLYLPFT